MLPLDTLSPPSPSWPKCSQIRGTASNSTPTWSKMSPLTQSKQSQLAKDPSSASSVPPCLVLWLSTPNSTPLTANPLDIRKQSQELRTTLHNSSSTVANNSATYEDFHPLQSALCDLLQGLTTSAPTTRATALTALPVRHPAAGYHTPPNTLTQPPPQPHAPTRAPSLAHPPPPSPSPMRYSRPLRTVPLLRHPFSEVV